MEKKLQKLYHTDYNLLVAQDLWQAHGILNGRYYSCKLHAGKRVWIKKNLKNMRISSFVYLKRYIIVS